MDAKELEDEIKSRMIEEIDSGTDILDHFDFHVENLKVSVIVDQGNNFNQVTVSYAIRSGKKTAALRFVYTFNHPGQVPTVDAPYSPDSFQECDIADLLAD